MEKIELRGIEKAYGKNAPVIEDLDLSIEEGSFTVLLGPSGCGKSTILRIIAGLEKETAGDVMIDGASVKGVAPGDRNAAMVFQNYALYPTMTVRENIEFGLKNARIPKAERDARIEEIVGMVELGDYLHRKPQQLSGGQRQRVALARAIVKKPSVFLMDEPLSNLDAKLRAQIRTDLIQLYHRLNTTFVYVTHDQVEAMSMGTRIILLDQGKIKQAGTPENIYRSPRNMFTAQFIGSPPMNLLATKDFASAEGAFPSHVRHIGFRPEKAAAVSEGAYDNDNFFYMSGKLLTREMLGDQILCKLETPQGIVQFKTFDLDSQPWASGNSVRIAVNRRDLVCFDEAQNTVAW